MSAAGHATYPALPQENDCDDYLISSDGSSLEKFKAKLGATQLVSGLSSSHNGISLRPLGFLLAAWFRHTSPNPSFLLVIILFFLPLFRVSVVHLFVAWLIFWMFWLLLLFFSLKHCCCH